MSKWNQSSVSNSDAIFSSHYVMKNGLFYHSGRAECTHPSTESGDRSDQQGSEGEPDEQVAGGLSDEQGLPVVKITSCGKDQSGDAQNSSHGDGINDGFGEEPRDEVNGSSKSHIESLLRTRSFWSRSRSRSRSGSKSRSESKSRSRSRSRSRSGSGSNSYGEDAQSSGSQGDCENQDNKSSQVGGEGWRLQVPRLRKLT